MSPDLLVVLLGAFLAAFATGAAGFGDAVVAISVWLYVLSPHEAVPLVVACGAVISLYSLWKLRGQLDYSKMPIFMVVGTVGVPFGAWILKYVEPDQFRTLVGGFLIAYSLVFLAVRTLPKIEWGGRWADGAVALIGGVMGGFAGLCGVAPTIWCGLRGWPKATQRGIYQPFLAYMHLLSLGSLAVGGLVTVRTGERFLWCLPMIVAGVWLGIKLYDRLDEILFRRVVLAILLLSGLTLFVSGGNPNG